MNTHAGITPLYRGVHGGYWALVSRRPEEVGTTIHLIDQGIDTGAVLARVYFDTAPCDSIATYRISTSQLACPPWRRRLLSLKGVPLLANEEDPQRIRLVHPPTLWGYLREWFLRGVR